MTQVTDIGWRIKKYGTHLHYFRARDDMKNAVAACWLVADKDKLYDCPSCPKCVYCMLLKNRPGHYSEWFERS